MTGANQVRSTFLHLFLLFALLPLIELALLIQLGQYFGMPLTVALVLGTGAAGAVLARSQGMRALASLRQAVSAGSFPGDEIFTGVLILAGGLLLLTPGFITDTMGFAALIPGTRGLIKAWLKHQVRRRLPSGEAQNHQAKWVTWKS